MVVDLPNFKKDENIYLKSLLCCPYCRSHLKDLTNSLCCEKCNLEFLIDDGIYYFNLKSKENLSSKFKMDWKKILEKISEYENPTISQKIDVKIIKEMSSSIKGKLLLDAGCGTGLSTLNLLNKGACIIFLDIIPESLKIIQKIIKLNNIKGKVLFIVGDLTNLPLKSKSVNIIWSGGVLEHFKSFKKPYIELYRVLKKKGDLIFTIPNKFGLQRILSSIKDIFIKSPMNHYETGFIYYQLNQLFPTKYFQKFEITCSGIEQTYYDLFLPLIKFKLPNIFFLIYKYIILLFSTLLSPIKFSASWFILYGKKN